MQVSSRHVLRPGRLPFLPFRCCAFAPCPERTPCQERSLYLPADCSRLRQSWQDLSRPACIPWADPQPGPVVFRLCEPPSVQTDVCRLFDLRRCVVYKNSNDNDYSIALGSKVKAEPSHLDLPPPPPPLPRHPCHHTALTPSPSALSRSRRGCTSGRSWSAASQATTTTTASAWG